MFRQEAIAVPTYLILKGQLSASFGMVGCPILIHRPQTHQSITRLSARIFRGGDWVLHYLAGWSRAALSKMISLGRGLMSDDSHFDGARIALDR